MPPAKKPAAKAAAKSTDKSTDKSEETPVELGRGLKLHHLRPAPGAKTAKTRVGRGEASKGKTAGRGTKGTHARTTMRPGFEGGQMPIYMRLGKLRGNTSKDAMPIGPFRTFMQPVNLRDLDRFDAGDEVTPETLVEKRLIKNTRTDVKLLGVGEVTKKLTIRVHAISASARAP